MKRTGKVFLEMRCCARRRSKRFSRDILCCGRCLPLCSIRRARVTGPISWKIALPSCEKRRKLQYSTINKLPGLALRIIDPVFCHIGVTKSENHVAIYVLPAHKRTLNFVMLSPLGIGIQSLFLCTCTNSEVHNRTSVPKEVGLGRTFY
jgi:hypothetical protein